MKKIIKLGTPTLEYEVGRRYPCDPEERTIASIERIQKTGEMAYVDWFQVKDKDGNLIGEIRGGSLVSILYSKNEDEENEKSAAKLSRKVRIDDIASIDFSKGRE
jgi:hypothetical protein